MGRSLRVQKREERRRLELGDIAGITSVPNSRLSPRLTRKTRQSLPAQPPPKSYTCSVRSGKSRSTSTDVSEAAPEIIVWTAKNDSPGEHMDADEADGTEVDSALAFITGEKPDVAVVDADNLLKVKETEQPLRDSMASSMSIGSDQSDLSSVPSNFSSRATTPADSELQRRVASDPIPATASQSDIDVSQMVLRAKSLDATEQRFAPSSEDVALLEDVLLSTIERQPQKVPRDIPPEPSSRNLPEEYSRDQKAETRAITLERDEEMADVDPQTGPSPEVVQEAVQELAPKSPDEPQPTPRSASEALPETMSDIEHDEPPETAKVVIIEPDKEASIPTHGECSTQLAAAGQSLPAIETSFEVIGFPSAPPAEPSNATPTPPAPTAFIPSQHDAPTTPLATPPATTPAEVMPAVIISAVVTPAATPTEETTEIREMPRCRLNIRPRSSIPTDISSYDYARECIEAAENSRLLPFSLHPEEYDMLRDHISNSQVTTYLNIRNGILRQWMKNPTIAVTREEAVGCASARWVDVASVCYDWLVRAGHINFGCVEDSYMMKPPPRDGKATDLKRKTIVVIGAGMSGLGCARQLEGLFKQYEESFHGKGESRPKVIVLEARSRIGGRVYSRPFSYQVSSKATKPFTGERCTCEIGGMIITGFIGNPLNYLVRGQLGLPYHALNPKTTIYEYSGQPVNEEADARAEVLFNDCLDRVFHFKFKTKPAKLISGKRELMEEAKDAGGSDNQKTIAQTENEIAALTAVPAAQQSVQVPVGMVMTGSDNVTGRVQSQPGVSADRPAAEKLKAAGWELKPGVKETDNIDLGIPASTPGATLGSVLENGIEQYKNLVHLTPEHLRLINWHIANLEYSNATNISNLSLPGWDIDMGNEWTGKHTMIVGGYQRVPRGLLLCPTELDLRTESPVAKISYQADDAAGPATITCHDGTVIEADRVVSTIPLGVLKHGDVEFDPPLPEWKTGAIGRLGWGVLNKIILTFDKPFWDVSRDFFGVVHAPNEPDSVNQIDYRSRRGRFFQVVDVTATSGVPCLVALMAGDGALYTEETSDGILASEATAMLKSIFPRAPEPQGVVVTRWASDPYARGSYSSAGPNMKMDDYDAMARPIGNLYFAGEHTIGTHPATVHGAYMSGLRAASEILTSMIGGIPIPTPLIRPAKGVQSAKRKAPEKPLDPKEVYECDIEEYIVSQIGPRPLEPDKVQVNAYRLFMNANQGVAREKYQADIRPGKRKGKAGPNDIRNMISKMWKATAPEEKKPFEDRVKEEKRIYVQRCEEFRRLVIEWDQKAVDLRVAYEKDHPFRERNEGEVIKRRWREKVNYNEDGDSDLDL